MRIRIRFTTAPAPALKSAAASFAALSAGLLPPAALVLLAMALWRLAADLRLAAGFVFSEGLLSHWQAWAAGAVSLQAASRLLERRAGRGTATAPDQPAPRRAAPEPAAVRTGDG